jgi:hypothetical protein
MDPGRGRACPVGRCSIPIHDPFLWRDEPEQGEGSLAKINPVPWLVTKWEHVNPTTMR